MKNMNKLDLVNDFMDFMDNNISYGWLGIDNIVRVNSLKDFKEYYRTMSIEDIIKNGVGLCPDQVNLVKNFLDKNNIENKILVLVGYEKVLNEYKERVHFIIVFNIDGIWYQFEHASRFFKGIFKCGTFEETKVMILNKYKNILKNVKLFEIDNIPIGMNYIELKDMFINDTN